MINNKKGSEIFYNFGALNINLAIPAFPGRFQPSIIGAVDLTSVFEMGTGVTPQLYSPGNFLNFFLCSFQRCNVMP